MRWSVWQFSKRQSTDHVTADTPEGHTCKSEKETQKRNWIETAKLACSPHVNLS